MANAHSVTTFVVLLKQRRRETGGMTES